MVCIYIHNSIRYDKKENETLQKCNEDIRRAIYESLSGPVRNYFSFFLLVNPKTSKNKSERAS